MIFSQLLNGDYSLSNLWRVIADKAVPFATSVTNVIPVRPEKIADTA